MSLTELINSRYSCRNYSNKPVEKALVEKICLSALQAPSACNSQPWKIHAFCGEKKAELASALQGLGLNGHASTAPVILAIEETQAHYLSRFEGLSKPNQWAEFDVGILATHIILLAKDNGLDSCIIGFSKPNEVKKILQTENDVPLFITLGYAAETDVAPEKRRKNTTETFIWEK